MTCVLCQFDLPQEADQMTAYSAWIRGGGLKGILAIEGLTEMRVYRNIAESSPQVTAMIFFKDTHTAMKAASTSAWPELVSALTRYHCRDVTLTLLDTSPLFPEPLRPG